MNEVDLLGINKNIFEDINLLQIKKRISRIKKSIQSKRTKKEKELSSFEEINNANVQASENNVDKKVNNEQIKKKCKCEKSLDSMNNKTEKQPIFNNKYRQLIIKKNLYDSLDDEDEYKVEEIEIYISPDSLYIKIFDHLIFISSIIYFIFVPFLLSMNFFIIKEKIIIKYLYILIDKIYI